MSQQYTLLRQQSLGPRQPTQLHLRASDLRRVVSPLQGEVVHVDIETNGLDPRAPGARVVTLGLAHSSGLWVFDTRYWADREWDLCNDLLSGCKVVAFNAAFELKWLKIPGRCPGLQLHGCSLVLYRTLANEGYTGQRWSLETAQTTVLGWPDSNKDELGELLTRHKLVRANGQPDKGEMYQLAWLEPDRFQYYCAQDAEASRQLWDYLLAVAHRLGLPAVHQYVTEEWPTMTALLSWQYWEGMTIDRSAMQAAYDQIVRDIAAADAKFRQMPILSHHLVEWERLAAADLVKTKITEKRVRARKSDEPWSHPSVWSLVPDPRTGREFYLTKWEQPYGGYFERVETTTKVTGLDKPFPNFNLESDHQLRWLLYERLYTHVKRGDRAVIDVEGSPVEVTLTKGGNLPVGKDVLPALGEVGRVLTEYNKKTKLLSYVKAYLALSEADSKLHASFKDHGTLSGRLAGG